MSDIIYSAIVKRKTVEAFSKRNGKMKNLIEEIDSSICLELLHIYDYSQCVNDRSMCELSDSGQPAGCFELSWSYRKRTLWSAGEGLGKQCIDLRRKLFV